MISFRYHIVSLIGVFLALALGIVVGTTALNGPITTDLRHQVDSLKSDRTSLSGQVGTLQGQVSDAQKFATEYGGSIVKGSLTGLNVVMLGLPGADSAVKDGVAREIVAAGGTVTARIQLTGDYTDPARSGDVTNLVTTIHPLGLVLPTSTDAGQLGGALLAYVLAGKGTQTDLLSVLGGFAGLHMLAVETKKPVAAANVLVVGGGTVKVNDAGGRIQLDMVSALQQISARTVVAGDPASATGGGVVALVRTDAVDKSSVSTVDNADTSMGQVTAVLALAGLARSDVGHYGTGSGAQQLFPDPPK